MQRIPLGDVPVAIDGGAHRLRPPRPGELTVGYVRLARGAGLDVDPYPFPHWGYMLKGRIRKHTSSGPQDFGAGESFYWAAGHAPEALEDSEYVDFSPARNNSSVRVHALETTHESTQEAA